MKIWPGEPYPLGATWDGTGTNFSLFSEVAERVELCLFNDAAGGSHEEHLDLPEVTAFCWHGYVPGVGPGQRYGFRVHGPWAPAEGRRCNPAKLLLDPYAKAVEGTVRWDPAVFSHRLDEPAVANDADSAPFVPRSIVISPFFDWGNDHPPRIPRHETVVYETHVKGLTQRHPEVPPELRGRYAGLVEPAVLAHLKRLGVTAIELLPVHQFVHDGRLLDLGLRNYWGYNSISYLAPHNEYAASGERGQQVQEWKQLVKTLHAEGFEVILDVVYNHTAEGNHEGPTLCFKGIDNAAYYRLVADRPDYYLDYTGTGNSNAYCQDNEISWYDWEAADEDLLDFAAGLIHLRREHPVFRRRRWFHGRPLHGAEARDVGWFRPDGAEMSEEDWQQGFARSLGVYLNGEAIPGLDRRGEPVRDDTFYLLFNAAAEPLAFRLPGGAWGGGWIEVFDTGKLRFGEEGSEIRREGEAVGVTGRGVVLLRKVE